LGLFQKVFADYLGIAMIAIALITNQIINAVKKVYLVIKGSTA
jgi:hypothetical protein